MDTWIIDMQRIVTVQVEVEAEDLDSALAMVEDYEFEDVDVTNVSDWTVMSSYLC